MEKFINDKGRIRELVRVASADSACGYVTTYRDAMKPEDVEYDPEAKAQAEAEAKAQAEAEAKAQAEAKAKAGTASTRKSKK